MTTAQTATMTAGTPARKQKHAPLDVCPIIHASTSRFSSQHPPKSARF